MDAIFAFCVLQFILDTSLFNKIFTNRAKSVILFYSEVSFYQPPFLEFLIFELYRKLLLFFIGLAKLKCDVNEIRQAIGIGEEVSNEKI